MIKGVLFDIDSTLLSHKIHAVPRLTIKLLDKLKSNGYKLGICTSRNPKEMQSVPKELLDYMDCEVISTGAITIVKNDDYYKSYPINKELTKQYINYFRQHHIPFNYTDISGAMFFDGIDSYSMTDKNILWMNEDNIMLKEFEGEEVTSLFFHHATEDQIQEIEAIDPNQNISIFNDSGNINASYVDKSFGLLKFCQMFSFTTDEICACGDGINDDLMLQMAGIGIAVYGSKPNTIAAADYVCKKPIEEGGLYEAFIDLNLIEDDKRDIKMFFFDNDSTLFDHNVGYVRESTYEALEKLKSNGYKIALNTSRSLEETYNIPKRLMDVMDCIILLNGAYVIKDGKVEIRYLPQDDVDRIIKCLDDNDITYRYALDNGGGYVNRQDNEKLDIFYKLYNMRPPVKKYEGEKVIHILYYAVGEKREEVKKCLTQGEGYCDLGIAGELNPIGMSKGQAMLEIGKEYGFDASNLCACGDGNNDIEMLSYAELGICMGNGSQELKNVADYVTDDISSEGLYNAMKHFGFIN